MSKIAEEYDEWSIENVRKVTGWSFLMSRGDSRMYCEKCVYGTGDHAFFCDHYPKELKVVCTDGMKMRGQ